MKFLCYAIHSGDPEIKEPVGYCILGAGEIASGPTLTDAKHKALHKFPSAEFLDDCGWILEGEEDKLLDFDNQDLLAFNIKQKYSEQTKT